MKGRIETYILSTTMSRKCLLRRNIMQDLYVGDIGDFGKYGLLRKVCGSDLTLAINWYKVSPKTLNKQNDGRYIDYLSQPKQYRYYDTVLFDTLQTIVLKESQRTICEIEKSGLLDAIFFSDNISINITCKNILF